MSVPRADRLRTGLTLVELLVVLVILAVLTTIAVQATSTVADQTRHDVTQRTLQNISDAIIGPANQRAPDGSMLITGFVADMGRLPVVPTTAATLPADPLSELWDFTAVTGPTSQYSVQTVPSILVPSADGSTMVPLVSGTPSSNVTASLACGWRGPYIRLPVGSSGLLRDGWRNSFQPLDPTTGNVPLDPTTGLPLAGTTVSVVGSVGADGGFNNTLPADPSGQDQFAPAQNSAFPLNSVLSNPLNSFSSLSSGTASFAGIKTYNTLVTPPNLIDPLAVSGTSERIAIVVFGPSNGQLMANPWPTTGTTRTAAPTLPAYMGSVASGSPTITTSLASLPSGFTATGNPIIIVNGTFISTISSISGTTVTMANNYSGSTSSSVLVSVPSPIVIPTTATDPTVAAIVSQTIGPRAIQAFQYTPGPTSGTVVKRSPLIPVMVPQGGLQIPVLVLQ